MLYVTSRYFSKLGQSQCLMHGTQITLPSTSTNSVRQDFGSISKMTCFWSQLFPSSPKMSKSDTNIAFVLTVQNHGGYIFGNLWFSQTGCSSQSCASGRKWEGNGGAGLDLRCLVNGLQRVATIKPVHKRHGRGNVWPPALPWF